MKAPRNATCLLYRPEEYQLGQTIEVWNAQYRIVAIAGHVAYLKRRRVQRKEAA